MDETTTPPPTPAMNSAEMHGIYSANIVQLFLGILITAANALVAFAIASRPRLKTSTNLLLGNICFANLIVGVMLSVANVTDGWHEVNLLKTESALVVVDCFVNIATILALITNTFVAIRSPAYHMTSKNCIKIIFGIWAAVLFLCLVKAIVFSLDRLQYSTACYSCFVVFEIVTLTIFSTSTGVIFTAALYVVVSRRKRAVSDQERPAPNDRNREFSIMVTAGILMVVYFVCFIIFVLMYVAWMANHHSVTPGTSDLLLSIFFLHSIINPFIIAIRHKDLRNSIKNMICCCCADTEEEADHVEQNGAYQNPAPATRDAFLRGANPPVEGRPPTVIDGPGRAVPSASLIPSGRTPPDSRASVEPGPHVVHTSNPAEVPDNGVRLTPLGFGPLPGEQNGAYGPIASGTAGGDTEAAGPPITTV